LSGQEEDEDQEADGVQAFRDLTSAIARLSARIDRAESTENARLDTLTRQNTAALDAAKRAQEAAGRALKASEAGKWPVALWAAVGASCALLAGVLGGYLIGQSSGWDSGHAAGYASARNEVAAAAWANTPIGRRALALDQIGALTPLTDCTGQGWRTEKQGAKRVCFPGPNATSGWFIP
jgi:hypothetical protein